MVLGDLAEEFDQRLDRDGSRSARRWYWNQVWRSIAPSLERRVHDSIESETSRESLAGRLVSGVVTDLRERGFALVVVDVLRHEPPVTARSEMSSLALRLWRLDREALRVSLAGLGVPVISWPDDQALDAALAPMHRVMAVARRP